MNKSKTVLTLAGCVALWSQGSATALGEEGEASPRPMSETAAPFIKPESSITFGLGHFDGKRQQSGVFDNQRGSGTVGLLDADILMRDDASGTWTTLNARNMGMDNRDVKLGYNKQGTWGVGLGYDEMTRQAPYTVATTVTGLGTPNLFIPASSNGTGGAFKIGTERQRFNLDAFRFINKDWKLNLGLRYEKKDGTRHWGRGSSPTFIVEPIDWITRQADLSLSYLGKNTQVTGGYSGSWFENAFSLVDATEQGENAANTLANRYISLPLDNNAHQFYLQGGHNFTPKTRGTFKISHTRASQNEHMPTADVAAGFAAANAPTSLQGQVDTTLATVGLSAQPLPKLRLVSNLRYYNVEDKTPAWLVVTGATEVHSTPISNETISGKVEGTYRLDGGLGLLASVEHKDQNRQIPFGNDNVSDGLDDERFVPFRSDISETTYKVQARKSLLDTLNGTLGYQHAVRDGSSLSQSVKIMGNAQGKISPFFIADRVRDKVRFSLDWNPLDSLDVQFNFENALDRYEDGQPYGRKKGEARLYSVDANYAFTKKLLFTAWFTHDTNQMRQTTGMWAGNGTQQAEKFSILNDEGDSLGLGVRHQFSPDIKVGSNFQWTQNTSEYNDTVVPVTTYGTLVPLKNINSATTKVNAFLEYANIGPGLLRFDYIHEHWRTNDWTWQFSNGTPFIYGTATDGSMVITQPKQTSNFLGVRYTTKFQ